MSIVFNTYIKFDKPSHLYLPKNSKTIGSLNTLQNGIVHSAMPLKFIPVKSNKCISQ